MNTITVTGSVMYDPMVQQLPNGMQVVNVKVMSTVYLGNNERHEVFQLSFFDCADLILPDVQIGRWITATGTLTTKVKKLDTGLERTYLNVKVGNWEWHDRPHKEPSHLDFEQAVERWY